MKSFFEKLIDDLKKLLRIQKPISQSKNLTPDDTFNGEKLLKEEELNRILDKINSKGMSSLSKREKNFLEEQSH